MADPRPETTLRIRIACGPDIAIGLGKADLLEAIGRTGSISAAAREQGLSYRKAWSMVSEMNQCFREPVVVAAKGGLQGGGANLTPSGREALERYRRIQAHAAAAIAADLKAYRKLLRSRRP